VQLRAADLHEGASDDLANATPAPKALPPRLCGPSIGLFASIRSRLPQCWAVTRFVARPARRERNTNRDQLRSSPPANSPSAQVDIAAIRQRPWLAFAKTGDTCRGTRSMSVTDVAVRGPALRRTARSWMGRPTVTRGGPLAESEMVDCRLPIGVLRRGQDSLVSAVDCCRRHSSRTAGGRRRGRE
jgi:hypothetical protein